MDAVGAVSALHDSTLALTDALRPVARALGPFDVLTPAAAGDQATALVLGQVRSCISSMHEVVAHVFALGHLWDERHLPALATERPVVTATSLSIVSPRDAWWRSVEALAFGSARGNAALAGLRAIGHPLTEPVAAVAAAAEGMALTLAEVEPYLAAGVSPGLLAVPATGTPEPAPAAPDVVAVEAAPQEAQEVGARTRRQPRWGPAG
jgi:hypothetical protein